MVAFSNLSRPSVCEARLSNLFLIYHLQGRCFVVANVKGPEKIRSQKFKDLIEKSAVNLRVQTFYVALQSIR